MMPRGLLHAMNPRSGTSAKLTGHRKHALNQGRTGLEAQQRPVGSGRTVRTDLPCWSAPERYNIPRYGRSRRNLSIVNPVNQLHVADLIAQNWQGLRQSLKRSTISEFEPNFIMKGEGRAISGVDFEAVSRRRLAILARYGRYVKTDVTRFYSSVYTHSIAWAILGKDVAKATMNTNAYKSSFANYLDRAVRSGQLGQTVGIPIGPDTSRIISEVIATEIEQYLSASIDEFGPRSVRYVDDMILGLRETETPEAILSSVSSALYEYELELNSDKTFVVGRGERHPPEWLNFIRSFRVNDGSARGLEDLDSFFEQAMYLQDNNPKDSVLQFAVKRASNFHLHRDNHDHFVRWLLYSARRASNTLSFVVEFLAIRFAEGKDLPLDEISHFVIENIPPLAAAAHTHELAWLLFLCRELKISLPANLLNRTTELRNGSIALLVHDLQQRKLIEGNLNTDSWEAEATAKGLKSELWLASYELTMKDWWAKTKSQRYITNHEYFGALAAKNVQFYDPKQKVRLQFRRPLFRLFDDSSLDESGTSVMSSAGGDDFYI